MLSVVVPVRDHLRTVKVPRVYGTMISGDGPLRYAITFNPSRVLMPNSIRLCPTAQVEVAVAEAVRSLGHGSRLTLEMVMAGRPTRVDVARDFSEVRHLAVLLEGLRHVPGRHGAHVQTYDNGGLGLYWNGQSRGKSSSTKVYDQHRRRPSLASPGSVRFEVRARSPWLERAGIGELRDVSPERVERLLLRKWTDSRFGTAVMRPWDLIDLIFQQDWSPRIRDRHVCDMLRLVRGYPFEGSPLHRRHFLERIAAIGVMADGEVPVRRVRLDLVAGREVEGE